MADPPADAVFDHYQVLTRSDGSLHELGRGAMGITYKALDTNLQVPVALKVIHPGTLGSEVARENFVREARAAARLRHPHVASVFHLGTEGGACFYAMEFIAGETVESVVKRRGPLPPLLAAGLAGQVARALMAAEEQGLVHRDIKPSNLMLVNADRELCVKVIDFGLAMSARESGGGAFAGTPLFASPEQLERKATDIRSDLYSLGATLWFMLTGHAPFAGTLPEVMEQHRIAPPPLEELSALPAPLTALVARLLAKAPRDRPATAAALRAELEKAVAEAGGRGEETLELEAAIAEETSRAGDDAPVEGLTSGRIFGGHFEILAAPAEINEGWICPARDRETGREVRLLVLRQDLRAEPEALAALESEVAGLARISHPHLLGILGVETVEHTTVLVTEWCDGITLREVLRLHRELSAGEALALLEQMAPGVDYALAAGLPRLDLSLHGILVHFPGGAGDPEAIVRAPLAEWPPFQVKLNPLVLARELALSETWSGGQTMVGQPVPAPIAAGESAAGVAYLRELPVLVYELLGGAWKAASGPAADRYTPLANLTEDGNEVLREALDPAHPPGSAEAFLRALRAVEQIETHHRESPRPGAGATVAPPVISTRPRRSPVPLMVAALVLVVAGVAYFSTRPAPLPAAPTTTPEPEPAAPAEGTAEVPGSGERSGAKREGAGPPAAAAAPDRHEALKAAVARAEQTEAEGDLASALPAWIAIARAWPDAEVGRMRMELLLDKARLQGTPLSGPELERALPALREAAGLEVVSAMLLLGEALQDRDPAESFRWFSAAGAKGVPAALTQLGLMYSNGRGVPRDLPAAVESFSQAAAKGDSAAKAALAECFLTGKGVGKDEGKAIELLNQAVAQGNLRAMSRLATCYHQGTGIPKNFTEALRLYQAAAEGGFPEAIGNLGVLYINGEGVPANPRRAVELFQKGAGLGDGYCMYLYARCLESGTGVPEAGPEAQGWYKRSAAAGFPRAAEWCRQHGVDFH